MNITKDELSKLLKEAYDEGMCGYEDLKDDYVQQIVIEFSSQCKDKPIDVPSPAYTGGMTYTTTAAYSSTPIEISFSSTPMFTLDPPAAVETVPSADPHYNFDHSAIPDLSNSATSANPLRGVSSVRGDSVNRNGDSFVVNVNPDPQMLENIINRHTTNISSSGLGVTYH